MKKLVVILAVALAASWGGQAQARPALSCYVNLWVGGESYNGTVSRTVNTSCPFARRVAANSLRYIVNAGGAGDGDFYVRTYSPVTYRWYRMHCWAHGDLDISYGMHVDCRGGINARVIYVAHRR